MKNKRGKKKKKEGGSEKEVNVSTTGLFKKKRNHNKSHTNRLLFLQANLVIF
jgi:hypothetical protein